MNRREFLKSTAPAAGVGVVAGLGASVPAAAFAVGAAPEIAALADVAFAADRDHIAALEARDGAKTRLIELIGSPPPDARFQGEPDLRLDIGGRCDMFDYEGIRFELFDHANDGTRRRRFIVDPARLQYLRTFERLKHGDTPEAEYFDKRLRAAIAYEETKSSALEQSRLIAAEHEVSRTELIARKAAVAVIAHPISTPPELALKVRAWESLKRADPYGGTINGSTPIIMADALRICGEVRP